MVSVASLLNREVKEEEQLPTPLASPIQSVRSKHSSARSNPALSDRKSKKPKVAKDAVVFTKAKINGPVRYAPFETTNEKILEEMKILNVYPLPLARITDYPRHVPYNSEKRQLFQKTGRDALEVFQYTFQPEGHERPYAVLWDYNIGLVRMTPFFKCCDFTKTVPSKMLSLNPGLKELCHSLTGGAIVAQGYWVPYEAAMALASAFCWDFRYALVPVFGKDFPDRCASPNSDAYKSFTIDSEIIRQCAKDIEIYRLSSERATPKLENESNMSTADSPLQKPWQDTKRYTKTSFKPVNKANNTASEVSGDSPYAFLQTPSSTPLTSRVSSPAMSSVSPLATPASLHRSARLPSPREMLQGAAPEVELSSAPVSDSELLSSSDSDVSPKTTPRKRRFPEQRWESRKARRSQRHSKTLSLDVVNIETAAAAATLMELADAARKIDVQEGCEAGSE